MSRAQFFAFGNISIDDLVFADGTTMWCVPGGNSIYSALGIAVWGERPQVTAPIGPEYPVARLGERIDLSQCRRSATGDSTKRTERATSLSGQGRGTGWIFVRWFPI